MIEFSLQALWPQLAPESGSAPLECWSRLSPGNRLHVSTGQVAAARERWADGERSSGSWHQRSYSRGHLTSNVYEPSDQQCLTSNVYGTGAALRDYFTSSGNFAFLQYSVTGKYRKLFILWLSLLFNQPARQRYHIVITSVNTLWGW